MILSMKQIKMNITSVILVMSLEIQEDWTEKSFSEVRREKVSLSSNF
jgi:hypothetical protein